jgi:hypothetical protein
MLLTPVEIETIYLSVVANIDITHGHNGYNGIH